MECNRLACERHCCQSELGLAHDGSDTGKVCLLQDLRVGDLVLPADVEKVSEASEMKLVLSVTFWGLGT